MTDEAPRLSPRAQAELAARQAREAEALRRNLHRRKRQQRELANAANPPATPASLPPRGG